MKLNVKAFTLAFGLLWGIGIFLLTWWLILFEGATGDPTLIGRLYIGYNISAMGSLIGLAWGLADGAVGGFLFSKLYNIFVEKFEKEHL